MIKERPRYYIETILGGIKPVPLMEWAAWFENNKNRIVAKTNLPKVEVSTVFLGLDHSFLDYGPPLLFETMVFGGPLDQLQQRYYTRQAAVDGHAYYASLAKWIRWNWMKPFHPVTGPEWFWGIFANINAHMHVTLPDLFMSLNEKRERDEKLNRLRDSLNEKFGLKIK